MSFQSQLFKGAVYGCGEMTYCVHLYNAKSLLPLICNQIPVLSRDEHVQLLHYRFLWDHQLD